MRCPFTKRCHPIDNAKTALTHCIDNAISAQSPKLPMHWQRPRFEILPLTLRCLRSHLDVNAFVSKLASHFNARAAQSKRELSMRHSQVWRCQCRNCAFCIGRAYHPSRVQLFRVQGKLTFFDRIFPPTMERCDGFRRANWR